MRVFVAGASGAIGQPLIAELVRRGHSVLGTSRSEAGTRKLVSLGAAGISLDVFDAAAVERALKDCEVEAVIDELTALPRDPFDFAESAAGDRRLRLEGGGNLYRAALSSGVRRYIQQSSGFFLKAESGLADEGAALRTNASPGVAASSRTYAELESRVLQAGPMEGIALRYGFFYGPKTWYNEDGAAAKHARRQENPVIGRGQGVWSWVHINDAAFATAEALTAPAGIYNIVDDDPSAVSEWLPQFAKWVEAPPPPVISEEQARITSGEDAVYYATQLSGALNAKAKAVLGFQPRRLEWTTA